MQFLYLLLQDAEPNPMSGFLLFGGLVVIFYLFMIRPQMKRQKEEKNFKESLEKGMKVMTIGGIYGKIVSMEEFSVIVQVDDTTKIRVDKTALRAAPDPKAEAAKK